MKKKIIKCFITVFMLFSMLGVTSKDINAANVYIGGVPSTIQPGGTFTISVSIPGYLGGMVSVGCNNCSVIGKNSLLTDNDNPAVFTIKAGSAGSASISVNATEVTSETDMANLTTGFGSAGFTIVAPTSGGGSSNSGGGSATTTPTEEKEDTRSKNNNLSALTISEGKLSPDFSADVTEYSVNLAATVTSIKVDATTEDTKSSVSGTGKIDVKPGENKITVTVTAENESTKSYVIIAKVDEKPLVYINYDKAKLGVVRNVDGVSAPTGFEKTTVKLNGKEIPAWKNNAMKTTIVYLVDEKTGEKNFYVFDTAKSAVKTVFKPTAILGHNVFIIDIDKDLQSQEGLVYKKVKVDTTQLMGWEFKDVALKNYALIYVMDENGKTQYYQYEKTQNTLQLYSGAAPVSKATYEDMAKDLDSATLMRNIFIGVSVLFAISTIVGFVLVFKNKKPKAL